MTDKHREQITELARTVLNFPNTHPIVLDFFSTYLMEGRADMEIVSGLTGAQGGGLRHALQGACDSRWDAAERAALIEELKFRVGRYMEKRRDIPYDAQD